MIKRAVPNIVTTVFLIITPIISAVLLFLAFPKYDLGWLGWIGLIPFLLNISNQRPVYGFIFSYICGFIFFTSVFSWTFEIPGYRLLHHIILGLYMGLYFGFFGLIFCKLALRYGRLTAFVSAPFIWVALEYIRSNFFFLALPWALMGHTQYLYPRIIQCAALTGAYGISFLTVWVNSALAFAILVFSPQFQKDRSLDDDVLSKKKAICFFASTVALLGLVFVYGNTVISKPVQTKKIKLSVLQGNIDREMKTDPRKYANVIMQKYIDLTLKAAKDKPDLIVWPEAATPGFVFKDYGLIKRLVATIKRTNTYFLIGSSEYPKFIKGTSADTKKYGNTALFFSSEGKLLGQYLKIHLVPFGEQIPYEGIITWPKFIVPEGKKSFELAGKDHTIFTMNNTQFGAVICWEVVFAELFRSFVHKGADFMINLTHEGWFGDSAAPYQLAAINVFRAVENRVPVARAANTGISCFIDPYGRITAKVTNKNKAVFVEGYLTREIGFSSERTFYTLYGDVFVYAVLIIAIVITFSCFLPRKRT
jgi:apolipoprotein N-acyltransferase